MRAKKPTDTHLQAIRDYVIISLCVVLAAGLRVELSAKLGPHGPFTTFFPPIVLAAWLRGLRGGLFSLVLSMALSAIYIVPLDTMPGIVALGTFFISGLAICYIGHSQRTAVRESRKLADEAEQREVQISASEARYRKLLETANEGMLRINSRGIITFVNPSMARMLRYEEDELLGSTVYDLFYPEQHEAVEKKWEARARGIEEQYEMCLRRKDNTGCWTVANVTVLYEDGQFDGTFNFFTDTNSIKQTEIDLSYAYRKEVLVNEIGRALRKSVDAKTVQQMAVDAMGAFLDSDVALSMIVDKARDSVELVSEWRKEGLSSLLGNYRLSESGWEAEQAFADGKTLVVSNHSPASDSADALLRRMNMRSYILVPLSDGNEVVGMVGVYMAGEREWQSDEISLVETVAAQLSATIQTAHLLSQTLARAEREALVNRIAQAQMDSASQEEVQDIAVRLLGDFLSVDRCYFDNYDFSRDVLFKGSDWHRKDLPSIAGYYSVEEHKPVVKHLFESGTAAISDIGQHLPPSSAKVLASLDHRAILAAPVYRKSELVSALYVAMAESQRDWTQTEIELVEQIAQITGTAVETVRINMREHTIAERLQEALQPTIPDYAHGLRMSCFYRPALDEAEVGGDFADCFATNDGCVVLVVGDLSGKGLDAAAQVATVRNMLRFSVYKEPTIAAAVNQLNRIIAENALVQGFATLFVGCYDSQSNELRYVNCGQEPGLIWRSETKEIVYLEATGPILGAFRNSTYDEITVPFFTGDQIALFTDGLTEAGPSRRQMLGIDGVAAVYKNVLQSNTGPKDVVPQLIDLIITASENIIRDDICLLIGQVEPIK